MFIDVGLARTAVEIAMQRHVAVLREIYTREGTSYLQEGKDLSEVKTVIGTGGVFTYGRVQREILAAALFDKGNPLTLKPQNPDCYVDERYMLYAVGLLSEIAPAKALRVAKRYLKKL